MVGLYHQTLLLLALLPALTCARPIAGPTGLAFQLSPKGPANPRWTPLDTTTEKESLRQSNEFKRKQALHLSPFSTSLETIASLRGGGDFLSSVASPSAQTILAASKFATGFIAAIGSYALVTPVTSVDSLPMFDEDIQENTFEASLVQTIGAIVVGFAIHAFLALSNTLGSGGVTLDTAMGCSLLPRIVLIAYSLARSVLAAAGGGEGGEKIKEYQLRGTGFLKLNFLMMSWCAFSLITGAGNPTVSAKVFSVMALIKALVLVTDPVKMTRKVFGVDVSGEGE